MYKTVTINHCTYEEIYEGPSRGRFEFAIRNMPSSYGRKDRIKFEYKRCIFEPDMHFGEMTAFKIAEMLRIPCCEVELFSKPYPSQPHVCETGCISHFDVGSDDILYVAENVVSKYAKRHGIKNYYLIDIDSIFAIVYDFFKEHNRPLTEFLKFKRDFIVMTIFDLKFGNFDRGINNWFIRKNKKTGEMELYPMFDNEAILGFTDDILDDMSYNSVSKFNNARNSRVTISNDMKAGKNTNFKDLYDYLLRYYPLETRYANSIFDAFGMKDLEGILNNLPGISEKRKEFAKKNYVYRTMELDRIKAEHEESARVKRFALETSNIDGRLSS